MKGKVVESNLDSLVYFIHSKKLEAPTLFLLESLYPCRGLMKHATDFFDPVGKLICPSLLQSLNDLFANQESYQMVIDQLANSNKTFHTD